MNDQSLELLFVLSGMFWAGLLMLVCGLYRLYKFLSTKIKGD